MKRLLAALVVAGLVQAPAAAGWSWPVEGPVLRPFVLGSDPYAAGQHRGVDIGAAPGTTVRAATGGSVSFVGTVPAGGRAVTVRTADGLSVTYLELGATRVERGAALAEGDPIGTIGPASHVHLGVRVTADEQGYLDPLQFLPARATGPARADPVPASPAAVVQPEPGGEPVDRAEPPAEAALKPKPEPEPEPEPAVAAPSTRAAAPTAAPVATEPALTPATAEPPPATTTAESGQPESEPVHAADDPAERSQASQPGKVAEPESASTAPASRRMPRPSRAVSPASPGARASRSRRIVAAPVAATRVAKPVTARPGKGSAIESHRGRGLAARQSGLAQNDSERSIASVALLGFVLAGVLGAVAAARRRHRRDRSAPPHVAGRCSLGRMRPPRLIHACVRARDLGWLATATRPRSVVVQHRPLPRPRQRRRVPQCQTHEADPTALAALAPAREGGEAHS
jgi:hypothetical protein